MLTFGQATTPLDRLSEDLEVATNRVFNWESLAILATLLLLSFMLGRLFAMLLRSLNHFLSRQADKSDHLPTVERYRRAETIIVISIALVRALLFAFAIYLWWVLTHPGQEPTAIVGASVIFAVIAGGIFGPVLRDLATGSMMMTEHWFAVGDHVKIEPFSDMQGVVERITLRSTRIRGLSGEVIWVNNQSIQGVRVAKKGIATIAIELFVSHPEDGQKLIEEADLRLPSGPLMVVTPLRIQSLNQVGSEMWHITAIGQTAPGREWLLEKYAIEVLQELDSKRKESILKSEPIARYTDSETNKKFTRTIQNARKVSVRPSVTAQIQELARERNRTKRRRKKQQD